MQRADLLLVNANVLTMDIRSPRSDSVAIKDGVIVAVGASATAELAGERVIDCGGLALIPGFHDAHCHLLAYASNLVGVDCSPGAVSSIAEIQEALRRRAQESPPDTWIRAWGYNEFYLAEGRHPSRWDLDAATPHHPVRLMHRSGHACVLNSRAMELAGISIETSDPPGGLIDRALPSGEPTGLLYEMEDFVGCSVPPLSQGELRQGVELASRNLISWGVTSVQDASPHNTLEDWSVMSGLRKDMLFTPRVTMMIAPEALESFLDDGLSYGKERDGLRVGAMKVVIDRTRGNLYPPLDDLKEQVAKAHSAGFQVALHAVEEETVEAAIQALRYARDSGPRRNQRHRIEHCSVCPPWLAQRIKEAGVMVVTQP
ncbi:MAG: Amidohydro 3 protein, partial [Dehalococcoidia bacterium]|nr:Amidohydro 3 protein [Dehalococcoidia bacterium]